MKLWLKFLKERVSLVSINTSLNLHGEPVVGNADDTKNF